MTGPINDERLRDIGRDMFKSETRRGWIANKCSHVGDDADPNISEQEYVERFIELHHDRSIDELEDIADMVRPSNIPTAYERGE